MACALTYKKSLSSICPIAKVPTAAGVSMYRHRRLNEEYTFKRLVIITIIITYKLFRQQNKKGKKRKKKKKKSCHVVYVKPGSGVIYN